MQSILREFAATRDGDDVHVFCFRRDQEPVLELTKGVGAEENFYSEPATDGAETLDDRITKYEGQRLARILGTLRAAPNGTTVNQADAAELVDHLTLRSAHLRHSFADAGGAMVEKAIDLFNEHATVSGLLRAAGGDSEGSLISQSIEDLLKAQPQIAGLGIPKRVLERIACTLLEENSESLIGELRKAFTALRGAVSGLRTAARTGHNAGLAKTLGRTARTERLMAFQWSMERPSQHRMILPDCVGLALVTGSSDLQPLNLIDIEDARLILVPFGSRRLLVGRKSQDPLPTIAELNHASALCSHSFFVSAVRTRELKELSTQIGERNRGTINTVVSESVEEMRLKIQLPEPEIEPPTREGTSAFREPSGQPPEYRVTFKGCADEKDANVLGAAVAAIVSDVAHVEHLDRLDGITFASDYPAALRELDRGFQSNRELATRTDSTGTGVAMAPAVMRDGVIKKHIVIRGDFAWALTSEDDAIRSNATYILVHELMHVAYLQIVDEALPGTILRPLKGPYEAILNSYVGGAVETYLVARRCARIFPGRLGDLRQLVLDALARACESIPTQRHAYAQDRNLDVLANRVMGELGALILFASEFFGHSDGLDKGRSQDDDALQDALRQAGLERWAQRLHQELRRLWDRCGKWDSYNEFLVMNRSLERALWQFKIFTWEVEGDAPMYVLVLFDEILPASSGPPS